MNDVDICMTENIEIINVCVFDRTNNKKWVVFQVLKRRIAVTDAWIKIHIN